MTKCFLYEDLRLLDFGFHQFKVDKGKGEEEMSQFIKTDAIYGEVAKVIDVILTNFYRLRNPLQCVKYF